MQVTSGNGDLDGPKQQQSATWGSLPKGNWRPGVDVEMTVARREYSVLFADTNYIVATPLFSEWTCR